MQCSTEIHAQTLQCRLSGKFTFADNATFRDIIDQFQKESIKEVILDFSAVDFIDSAALGMLLLCRDEGKKRNITVHLKGATGQPAKMFDISKFGTLFSIT